jgi:mono/diheme cytochrome c family protein
MSTTRRLAVALVALVLCVGLPACGGDDEGDATTTTTTEETTTDETATGETSAAGLEIFTDNCGSCHTLSAAGTTGAVGPSLDDTTLDVAAVEAQVRNGGGGMPAFEGELTDEDISVVAAYVVESAR